MMRSSLLLEKKNNSIQMKGHLKMQVAHCTAKSYILFYCEQESKHCFDEIHWNLWAHQLGLKISREEGVDLKTGT